MYLIMLLLRLDLICTLIPDPMLSGIDSYQNEAAVCRECDFVSARLHKQGEFLRRIYGN
jgi:hypothetical protein